MNKVYVLPPREGWIIDRFVDEWNVDNADITITDPKNADVVWLLADFCWNHLPIDLLKQKKVITSIHHVVPEKFKEVQLQEFMVRDTVTDVYHVPNEHTKDFVSDHTKKDVHVINYWANNRIFRKTGNKHNLRKKYALPVDSTLIGSFQRDTEGYDLKSPKLEKGPDLLCDFIEREQGSRIPRSRLHVVLAGWRRQYVINRLNDAGISFSYFERPSYDIINELYQTLDLYPITSRYEGGPQALIECGLLGVPVVSRRVGMAESVLDLESINDDVFFAKPTVPNVSNLIIPHGYKPYRDLIQSM